MQFFAAPNLRELVNPQTEILLLREGETLSLFYLFCNFQNVHFMMV